MTAKKENVPWLPAEYEVADVASIKALVAGTATEHQQKRALNWIIEHVCKTYDMSYFPASDRDTAFAEGKRFVGNQIVKMIKLDIEKIKRAEK